MKHILIVCLILITSVAVAQDYVPEFVSDDCPYFMQKLADDNDTDISCGTLYVPEDRDDIQGSLGLELFVVHIESMQASDTAPIIYLDGGPGGAASALFVDWLESDLRRNYDIILIDQRGTGLSYPSLNCYEFDESDEENVIKECRERLIDDEDIDLTNYNSHNNANDIHDLLVALDIEEANIYGSSYGSRLGLTLARDFPQRMRTLIIDAVYPPHVDALVEEATYSNQAIERLFSDCLSDTNCNSAYPDLRVSFYLAIDEMNNQPAEIEDFELGFVIEVNGNDFLNQIISMLYDTQMLPYLPVLIDAYANGEYDYDPYFEAEQEALEESIASGNIEPDEYDVIALAYLEIDNVDDLYDYYSSLSDDQFNDLIIEIEDYAYYMPFHNYLEEFDTIDETADYIDNLNDETYFELEAEVFGVYDDDSEGMYWSVECSEEVHFNTEEQIRSSSQGLPDEIENALVESTLLLLDECDIWNVPESDDSENEPVISDIPTLIFSGRYDPVTPYQWGDEAQSYLSNSWHYIFPNVGHIALDTQECPNMIALSFLENPMQEIDSSCLDQLGAPEFYIRP